MIALLVEPGAHFLLLRLSSGSFEQGVGATLEALDAALESGRFGLGLQGFENQGRPEQSLDLVEVVLSVLGMEQAGLRDRFEMMTVALLLQRV